MPAGLPQGGEFQRLQKFKGLNTQALREAIDDQEFSWLENLIPIGDGNLRAMPGPSAPVYTPSGATILNFHPFNIAAVYYHAVFLSDGSLVVVNVTSSVATTVFPSGTFSVTSPGPAATQWGNQYLLVIDPVTGYYIWDGTAGYIGQAGNATNTVSLAPVVTITNGGTGYTSGATAAASGGLGSGATFSVQVVGGIVIGVTVLTAGTGYENGDSVTLTISPVGAGSGATATVTLMPTGLIGTDIEVYESRVWILNKANIQLSAPDSVSNWSTGSGGDAFTATDSVLRVSYIAFRQSSGFLYPIADTSIDVINNVQTSSGGSTTFNNYNIDPQVGTVWRDSTEVFGRTIVLVNTAGVYGVYGGAAEKISGQLDGLFPTLAAGFIPSTAVSVVYGQKLLIVLLKVTDIYGVNRPIMFAWDGKKWFSASQNNNNVLKIATLSEDGVQQCWATDGLTLFQCFTTPTNLIAKIAQTKRWGLDNFEITKETQRFAMQIENEADNPTEAVEFTVVVDTPTSSQTFVLSFSGILQFVNGLSQPINFSPSGGGQIIWTVVSDLPQWANVSEAGKVIGATITSMNLDFVIEGISLMFIATTAY